MSTTENPGLSRRSMLCGVLVALAVPGGPAACGTAATPPAAPGTTGGGSAPTTTGGGPTTGTPTTGGIVSLAEVPDGGGVVVESGGRQLVVTRSGDTVKAFDASCPHAGTPVGAPTGGTITCPNHGSQFSATDGSLKKGPATKGLTAVQVKVQGDQVVPA
ncbi:nitrite reductase/ring-hydroxylating ferredoxin subunit [Saccharothrix tamanrassetensis]|uniref:Nitrite reductase/ring-hydroxylating ferredoxin subunit n=1 Tax=Saccharothrix tamanrassetensis TaxID=1051531 RepID=A0A841CRV4_9PSEU|nr:Rieske (2Fe-2S) protein [Saccharothrix tamanrassetensis]MBB5959074.1 nitrite reductase/ring-hydroxylating ferredoxin subunit [Saccharothrix tamanrassetensis]